MTIRPSNISQLYKAYIPEPKNSKTKAEQKIASGDRQDRLEISKGAAGVTRQQTISANVSREVSAGTSPQRLAELKESVASGTYNVSAAEISSAILFGIRL